MILKKIIGVLLKLKIFDFFIIYFFSRKIKTLHVNKINNYNLLILDFVRFGENIDNLIKLNQLNIFSLPINWQDKLTFLSESNFKNIFTNNEPIIPSINGLKYLENILLKILRKRKIKCVLSCGPYYERNSNWEKILNKSRIPMFCLHKESVGLSRNINFITNKNHYKRLRKFNGNLIFVANHHMKDLLSQINYFPKDKIKVVGLPKIDNLFHLRNVNLKNRNFKSKNKVVLFSFYHTYLLEEITFDKGRWSEDGSFGFYNLFDSVHATVANFAKNNKQTEVIIKLKWEENFWKNKVLEALKKYDLNIDNIPNLKIDGVTDAHNLISSCDTVIGFNSTTLTESLFLNKKTIIPCYYEAQTKYSDYVLWSDNKAFIRVFSENELYKEISSKNNINNKEGNTQKTLEEAFGYIDGNNTKRLSDQIINYINK